jgi:DNA-binding Lrp family transcriptional regulator
MGAKAKPVLERDDLNGTDEKLLDLLAAGRVTPPYAAEELDKSREYVSERLIRLKEHGHVHRIGRGLYELVQYPTREWAAEQPLPVQAVIWEHDLSMGEANNLITPAETISEVADDGPTRPLLTAFCRWVDHRLRVTGSVPSRDYAGSKAEALLEWWGYDADSAAGTGAGTHE